MGLADATRDHLLLFERNSKGKKTGYIIRDRKYGEYQNDKYNWRKKWLKDHKLASVDELKLEDELIDNKYYMGHITLSGEFETSIGDDARLIVKKKDDNEEHSYEIGTLVFINDENENYKECSFVNAEAVLKTDNNDNVYNLSLIHI